ncbi:hypothetical protein AFCDBAGC_1473 [Methylobacterium cerastii]|uniref:Uncharacterized protein n=1 Tax=Methylobacterium cerastii TaxID=932741 RepID=A0ABQ4QEG5_9HYPH|nr:MULTISPECIES: hypothetical protein [Methylobacterium]TXM65092.1 hypothetical protein FV229_16695 [Methylobacterium sp. WL120]TXM75000.1 hypothetical protein FV226_04775 [Methylobacterium sp. WL12]TXN79938.1 hypothetical protein FV234_18715 [Methylobacterium sp. WL8]GJD43621.1 hypothetical protein AFCDBAGC_1473 [Methylobacterium cerastii]
MIRRLAFFLLIPALATAPAFAEKAATGATVPRPAGAQPTSEARKESAMKAANQAEMLKAQKASAARDKAWDTRTRASMSSICKGC